jgi:hypothetical protein
LHWQVTSSISRSSDKCLRRRHWPTLKRTVFFSSKRPRRRRRTCVVPSLAPSTALVTAPVVRAPPLPPRAARGASSSMLRQPTAAACMEWWSCDARVCRPTTHLTSSLPLSAPGSGALQPHRAQAAAWAETGRRAHRPLAGDEAEETLLLECAARGRLVGVRWLERTGSVGLVRKAK